MSLNTVKHNYKVTKTDREKKQGNKAYLLWFTGLSGSGKSTLANLVEVALHQQNKSTYVLDGDNIRQGINKDLSFAPEDRSENIRRIAEISNLMVNAGVITIGAFVSPYLEDRALIK
jgi:adenylylsulfate kinase